MRCIFGDVEAEALHVTFQKLNVGRNGSWQLAAGSRGQELRISSANKLEAVIVGV